MQWAKHDFIESLERPNPPPAGEGPLSPEEIRAHREYFYKTNRAAEKKSTDAVTEFDGLIKKMQTNLVQLVQQHKTSPTASTLEAVTNTNSVLNELKKARADLDKTRQQYQNAADELLRKLDEEKWHQLKLQRSHGLDVS